MGSTANYSWPTPVATDLVKDGWEAIKDLGDAADTTVKAVADAQGLVHINTTDFNAVASQSINDVFSATYDNYFITMNFSQISSAGNITLRMRASGTDRTDSTYSYANAEWSTSITATRSENQSSYLVGASFAAVEHNFTVLILEPFKSARATGLWTEVNRNSSASVVGQIISGTYKTANQNDGFTLATSSGSMTGSISVYAYRKS